jgi:hypothetical protein
VRTAEPGNISYQRELALNQSLIAETLYQLGRKEEAQASFLGAFAIVESYAAKEPGNVQLQMDLVTGLYRLAYFINQDSAERHERALAIVHALASNGKLTAADKAWADSLEQWFAGRPT